MNDKINIIREKCIAANPRRAEGWDWDSGRPTGSGYMDHAPCRLADVILTLYEHQKAKIIFSADYAYYGETTNNKPFWYMPNDNLEKQSEATINFLAELLQ